MLESGRLTLGINYWASHAATRMWRQWDGEVVRHDLDALRKLGVTLLRVFPIWPDFQPVMVLRSHCHKGGYPYQYAYADESSLPDTEIGRAGLDATMLEHFQELADLALERGMRLIVPLLNGHMTFRLFFPPAVDGLDVFTDPKSIYWQVKFVRGFVRHFKDHAAIFAWELGNETNCLSVAESHEAAWCWTAQITDAIRSCDTSHPVISGMHGLKLFDASQQCWLLRDQAEHCDYLTTHPYAMWLNHVSLDAPNTLRWVLEAATETRMYEDVGERPSFVEEIGTLRRAFSDYDSLGRQYSSILWALWAWDCRGALWWCAFDQRDMEFPPYDWDGPGMEHGILDTDYSVNPTGAALQRFARFQENCPVKSLPRCHRRLVCILGRNQNHLELSCAVGILSAQAGCQTEYCHSKSAIPHGDVYLLPGFHGKSGLSCAALREVLRRVEDEGATLYFSADYDANLTTMPETVGVEITGREKNDCGAITTQLTLDGESVSLTVNPLYRVSLAGRGATSLDDQGLLWEFPRGKGRIIYAGLPLENLVSSCVRGFQRQPLWKLYRYLAKSLLVDEVLRIDDSEVVVSEHRAQDDLVYGIVINCSPEGRRFPLVLSSCWRVVSVVSDGDGISWQSPLLSLPGNGCALVTLQRA